MQTKRKPESKSTDTQSKKQQHIEEEQNFYDEEDYDDDLEEVEEEAAEEEEEEEDEEEEEAEDADDLSADNQITCEALVSAEVEDDEEPFQKLLEPLGKEQLINLLCEAAQKHADVGNSIRMVADEDPAHRKIFVHGLGWDTTTETLTDAFRQYGEIEDSKAVCDKISGKSKGYGFVLFKTRGGASNALKQPQKKIGSRLTSCQLASMGPVPSHATPAAVAPAPIVPSLPVSEYTQRKIYVSNVSAELDPQKLLTFFSKYGEIEEGPLGLDKQTGKPKGFCLLVYKTIESAKKALAEPHKNFEGHALHCRKAVDGLKINKSHFHPKARNPSFQRNDNSGSGHLMASAAPLIQYDQGAAAAAAQALTPALGQALTALLATQGASFGLPNLFGSLGTTGVGAAMNPAVPGGGHGIQGAYAYGNQVVGSSVAGYGNQVGYQNQQIGQGGSGRSQYGAEHSGGNGHYKVP